MVDDNSPEACVAPSERQVAATKVQHGSSVVSLSVTRGWGKRCVGFVVVVVVNVVIFPC